MVLADSEVEVAVRIAQSPSKYKAKAIQATIRRLLRELGYSSDGSRQDAMGRRMADTRGTDEGVDYEQVRRAMRGQSDG